MIWGGAVRPIWSEIPTTDDFFFNKKEKAELFSTGAQYDIGEDSRSTA